MNARNEAYPFAARERHVIADQATRRSLSLPPFTILKGIKRQSPIALPKRKSAIFARRSGCAESVNHAWAGSGVIQHTDDGSGIKHRRASIRPCAPDIDRRNALTDFRRSCPQGRRPRGWIRNWPFLPGRTAARPPCFGEATAMRARRRTVPPRTAAPMSVAYAKRRRAISRSMRAMGSRRLGHWRHPVQEGTRRDDRGFRPRLNAKGARHR